MQKTISIKKRQQRKFLTTLPLIVVPFLCLAFYALGGGRGGEDEKKEMQGMGFNMELPPAVIDPKDDKMNKLAYYERADRDSARRKELLQMDPYRRKDRTAGALLPEQPKADTQADVLLHRLELMKKQMNSGDAVKEAPVKNSTHYEGVGHAAVPGLAMRKVDTMAAVPELDRLNEMLDKIARLQGSEHPVTGGERDMPVAKATGDKEVSIGIPAAVDNNQELMNGAVLTMRLTSAVSYNGMILPRGQLVYGMVSMSNDRMQVSIHSIRCGSSILTTYWQVYDMDGLVGIRIPDGLGRQVARQSADQGIGSLNIANYDPSVGGQVAGAGIQVAKSFFSRKVRTVRVMAPAGYQVLLRDTRQGSGAGSVRLLADTVSGLVRDPVEAPVRKIAPPSVDSLTPYLHVSAKEGKAKLTLKGIYLRDGLMWLYMTLKDKGELGFVPEHVRCTIRQKKHWRRMAMQEVPLQPVYDSLPPEVVKGGEGAIMVALKPFVLAGEKQLVVKVGERDGGRELALAIAPHFMEDTR